MRVGDSSFEEWTFGAVRAEWCSHQLGRVVTKVNEVKIEDWRLKIYWSFATSLSVRFVCLCRGNTYAAVLESCEDTPDAHDPLSGLEPWCRDWCDADDLLHLVIGVSDKHMFGNGLRHTIEHTLQIVQFACLLDLYNDDWRQQGQLLQLRQLDQGRWQSKNFFCQLCWLWRHCRH